MTWSPPEPRTGSKYQKGIYTKEIAGLVRADIKAAVKAGELPKGTRATVKTEYFSGGSSIDVRLRAIGGETLQNTAYIHWHLASEAAGWKMADHDSKPEQYTENAKKTLRALEALLNAYHYDASDSSVDYFCVNFYGHARIAGEVERAEIEAEKVLWDTSRARIAEQIEREREAQYAAGVAAAQAEEAAKRQTPEYLAGAAAAVQAPPKELDHVSARFALLEID